MSSIRNISKSIALAEYAIENKYLMLTPDNCDLLEKHCLKKYNLCGMFSLKMFQKNDYFNVYKNKGDGEKWVIDEGIDINWLIKNCPKINIVTGYYTPQKHEINSENFKDDSMRFLKEELKQLSIKLENMRKTNNYGTYKNLILAYSEIMKLIDRYDWRLMYSSYTTEYTDESNNKPIKQVAVWEQNSDGLIRKHKRWDIK